MATRAETAAEGDVLYRVSIFHYHRIRSLTNLSRVDSNTVVLVVNLGTVNGDTSALTNIEAISVVSTLRVTLSIINGHLVDGKTVDGVDADSLDRGVLDVNVVEDRVSQAVGGEELGLLLATVSTLAVPPASAVSVKDGTGTVDSDLLSRDLQQRAGPLLVAPGGGALEDDL